MTDHILIVDDELAIRRLLRVSAERGGYSVVEAANAAEAISKSDRARPRLVLLDLGLPDRDGLELIPSFVSRDVPVIVLTAREASAEKVAALDLGADDYVTKPFDSDELLARIRRCLRRSDKEHGRRRRLVVGPVEIDLDGHAVLKSGAPVKLTPKEFALLAELAGHPGKVLTHTHLLREVWGPAHTESIEYLRVTVRALRKKIEDDPARPRWLLNEPGVGYRFEEAPS
ncbi:response regulator transcription factor [Mesobaculum littorinae]|uniref:Response regulator transcription factor n=1 Tax=Mesobaculum littorinae TaxID=2486419 RepID=A0A438AD51_9RHOB|nr:response regulator transcription factor [Mesobaculum littorinae]RVV96608.1 response regulator transcription factor [Mesobaculum littorinae]